jgi:flagellar biosynthesis/type III secretory pathway chaperone
MMQTERNANALHELERTLVKQFRTLQRLVEITRAERASLLEDGVDALQTNVEEKEAILDQLILIEDRRRMLLQEIALQQGLRSESLSIQDLLPCLEKAQSIPLERLSEGITTLVSSIRDLNYGNQALAASRLDWLKSLQSYLVAVSLPDSGYRPPHGPNFKEPPAGLGREYRA